MLTDVRWHTIKQQESGPGRRRSTSSSLRSLLRLPSLYPCWYVWVKWPVDIFTSSKSLTRVAMSLSIPWHLHLMATWGTRRCWWAFLSSPRLGTCVSLSCALPSAFKIKPSFTSLNLRWLTQVSHGSSKGDRPQRSRWGSGILPCKRLGEPFRSFWVTINPFL